MSSHKLKSFILGILISASSISIVAYAHSDGAFGQYFERMTQSCGLPNSTIIDGFSTGSVTDWPYWTSSCKSLLSLLGTIFGSNTPPADSSIIGFSSTGEIIYGSNHWKENGLDISYIWGKVGIGTDMPTTKLDVTGGNMNINNGLKIAIWNSDITATTNIVGIGFTYFNGGNFGIGTNNPTTKLEVVWSAQVSETLYVQDINLNTKHLKVPIVCTDANKALQWNGSDWLCN